MAWSRSGDLDITFKDESSSVNRRVIYSNKKDNGVVLQLEIYGFSNNSRIALGAFLSSESQLELFLGKIPRLNGPPVNVSQKKLRAGIETDNKDVLKDFLLTLHNIDKLDALSIKEISTSLKVDLPRELDEIIQLANSGKLQEALVMAGASTDPDACLDAGKHYELKAEHDKAAQFYLHMPKSHAHFHEGCLKAYEIVTRQLNAINSGKITVPREKIMGYEILKINCIFKMAENDAYLHDYFSVLQNNQVLAEKVSALERDVTSLHMQNAKLDQQLGEKEKAFTHFQSTPDFFKRL